MENIGKGHMSIMFPTVKQLVGGDQWGRQLAKGGSRGRQLAWGIETVEFTQYYFGLNSFFIMSTSSLY